MIETMITFVILANSIRSVPIAPDLELMARAQTRAEFLCETGQWSHAGRAEAFKGYSYTKYAGENLAKGFNDDPLKITFAWYMSPTHRANVLNPYYTKMGIGQACGITVALYAD